MANTLVQSVKRSGGRWFQALFVIAAILSASASYIALARSSPTASVPREVQILLMANTIILLVLGWMVVSRYIDLRRDKDKAGGGRLAQRFMLLFGLSVMIPTVIVSLFLWSTISKGIDTWFGQRVVTLVEETASVARENVEEFSGVFEEDAKLMAVDVNNAAEGYLNDRLRFESYLGIQAYLRNIPAAYIIDGEGTITAVAENMSETGFFRRPTAETFADLQEGSVIVSIQEDAGFASAVTKLAAIDSAYLYLAKPLDVVAINRLRKAEGALVEYRLAERRSEELKLLFVIAYLQIATLVLLLSVRFAQEVAARITEPIGRLAVAASEVSEGVRGVQVPLPQADDEVKALSTSFNYMTSQLDERRSDLIAARELSEQRRQFLETLLAELSAGVVRIDRDGIITLANRSARGLLNREDITGHLLSEIAPALANTARQTIETGEPIDASVNLDGARGTRHIRLKVTEDADGGFVLTFDDASRLVSAQRQLAWRDVARRIAHEIRNPLTPIQLSTERLRRRYSDKIDDSDGVFQRCLDTISRQVSDLGRMVTEFSDFARMPKPRPSQFGITALLEDICFAQKVVNPDFDITVTSDLGDQEILGDERLLAQAFGNIVKNAAQALASRPLTDEATGQIRVHIERHENSEVRIRITDNGPGFPDDVREKLLEPYVTTREGGAGLGLAIVNRIIMDHGGDIVLSTRSDGEKGAEVRVTLPIHLDVSSTPAPEEVEFAE
ncbi:MAG: ATP-binding protein [Henriciella sp.]|nr:ATP-binding protein [Henriciella sp.]